MGLRAHSVKKYDIEFGSACGFNYDPDTLAAIIYDFCDDANLGDDGFGGHSTDTIWEVEKGQFLAMVNELREMSEEEFNERMKEDWSYREQPNPTYTQKYVIGLLMDFYNDTPEKESQVRIGWL